jgi:hypothetical protein
MEDRIEKLAQAADEPAETYPRRTSPAEAASPTPIMIFNVTVATETGPVVYTGHVVCRGPGTMDMLLTEPFPLAGRSIQFPVDDILAEERRPAPGAPQSVPSR